MLWNVHISHTYREGNICVDALANLACSIENRFLMFDQPPNVLRLLL